MIVDLGNGRFQLKSKDGSRVLLKEGTRAEVEEAEERAKQFSTDHADSTWSTAEINDFPDGNFLHIESGGEKDSDGKTTPRSLRHFPYKGKDGKINLAHLRNAIAQAPKSSLPKTIQESVQKHAQKLLEDAEGGKHDEADFHVERGVFRFDLSELKPPIMEPNGWARVDGRIGKAGLLTYYRNGNAWIEYRPPAEAFHVDSLASAAGVPLTNGHPPANPHLGGARLLSAENTRDFQVGHVVGTPRKDDGDLVRADIMLTDAAAIEDAKRGRSQLSSGYVCDVEETPGEIDGQHYDAVQRRVRYNHVALVAEGRAGPQARVRVDSLELEPVASNHGQGDHAMKIRIDGVTFEVECKDASFEQVWSKEEKARADEAKGHAAEIEKIRSDAAAALSAAKGEVQKEKGRADAAETALKAKTDELQKAPEQIRAEIERRIKLDQVAREFLGQTAKLDELDDASVMKAVILAVDPEAKLDDVSADYLAANFDATLRFAGRSALERGSGPASTRGDGGSDPDDEDDGDLEEAKKKFGKASAEASKPKPKGKKAA